MSLKYNLFSDDDYFLPLRKIIPGWSSKKLYLDSASLEDIQSVIRTNAISGVTTNPSLMAKTSRGDYFERIETIAKVVGAACYEKTLNRKHLSVEVISSEYSEMLQQARKIQKLLKSFEKHIDLHIKIPVTLRNLTLITDLERNGIKVNATACMTHCQAKLASDAGASIVSFFYNRMKDGQLHDPASHITEFNRHKGVLSRKSNKSPSIRTKVICGSIRKPSDVYECWIAGADAVTVSVKIIEQLVSHPQTDLAINNFQKDIDAWLE